MTLYFVCQVGKDMKVLGVRDIYFQLEEAECDLWSARQEFKQSIEDTGWPIWNIIVRECEDL